MSVEFKPIDNESLAKAWFLMVLLIFVAAGWQVVLQSRPTAAASRVPKR